MKPFRELMLVNYCHPDTTAFYRFADFENYYALRIQQDAYLHARFIEACGQPEVKHPLSFVLEGSDYLRQWFAGGAEFQRNGGIEPLTVDMPRRRLQAHGGLRALLDTAGKHYVEAQLWSDRYICGI